MSATQNYIDKLSSLSQEPRDVIEIDFSDDGTDLYYFTDQQDTAVPSGAESVTQYGTIKKGSLSSVSQDLKPEAAKSSIGVMSVSLVNFDNDFSDLLKSKYDSGFSLKGKRVRHYKGFEGLAWADYTLLQTQIVEQATHTFGEYGIKCKDVQRSEKKDIFIKKLTNLRSDYSVGDTVLNVFSTEEFEACAHGASYTDAPNQTVYYIRISLDNGYNILRATGKNATQFTGITGGVLGSVDADIRTDDSATSDQQPLVEEHIYIELPAPKMAYAILTGEGLPSSWNLAIPTAYVDRDSFYNIGSDLFNTSNDSGFVLTFEGLEKIEGKKFIEKEILLPSLCITPIQGDGTLKLTRIDPQLSDGSYDFVLDESNIVKASVMTHDYAAVRNIIAIDWNYESSLEDFTRTQLLIDGDSINLYGDSDLLSLKFKGLSGSRHTRNHLYDIYDKLRDRYAGEPLLINVEAFLTTPNLELGDVARVQLSGLQDYLNGTTLDRSFEVQNIKANSRKGTVNLKLFGSGSKAGSINRAEAVRVIDLLWYSSQGTNIETAFAAYITEIGGVLHLDTNGATLNGTTNFNDAGSIFYTTKPFVIDSGITLNITGNVQLRYADSLQVNGTINGVGGNISGGYVGSSRGQGGGKINAGTGNYHWFYSYNNAATVSGALTRVPSNTPQWNGTSVTGLPDRLDGITGGAGAPIFLRADWCSGGGSEFYSDVGLGGLGGAGLLTIGTGITFGASGTINLSGVEGTDGTSTSYLACGGAGSTAEVSGGTGGGGASGMWFDVQDGKDAINTATSNNVTLTSAGCTPVNKATKSSEFQIFNGSTDQSSYFNGFGSRDHSESNRRSVYLQDLTEPEPNLLPTSIDKPTNLTLASDEGELLPLKDGTQIPQLTASWVNPTSQYFVGCRVEYKKSSDSEWISVSGLTSVDETSHSIPYVEEGVEYDVRIAAKSRVGTYSGWVYERNHPVIGKTSLPPTVAGFIATQNGESVVLKWDSSGINDSGGFEFRYAAQGNADWNSARPLTEAAKGTELTSKAIAPGTYTFFAKERDNGGRFSASAATYDLTITTNYDVIYVNEEHPTWPSVRRGFEVQNDALIPNVDDEAIYTTDEYDIGFDDTVRVWANIEASLTNVTSKVDRGLLSNPVTEIVDRGFLSDAVTQTVDRGELGFGVGGESANLVYEVATRKEGEYHTGADEIIDRGSLSETPIKIIDRGLLSDPVTKTVEHGGLIRFKPWTIGDIELRHIFQRVRCLPNESGALPALLKFSPTLDLYERKEKLSDLTVAVGGSRFNFGKRFHLTPFIKPIIIGSSSLYAVPTNEDESGFDVKVYNSAGTDVGLSGPNKFKFEAVGV